MGRSRYLQDTCQICGKLFTFQARGNADYCSNACKQKAYRIRAKQESAMETFNPSKQIDQKMNEILAMVMNESAKERLSEQLLRTIAVEKKEQRMMDILILVQCSMLVTDNQ